MGSHSALGTIQRAVPSRRAAVAMWICAGVGVVTMIVAVTASFGDNSRGPFVVYAALWLWAAYRLRRHGRAGLARGLSIVSLCVAFAALLGTVLFLGSWSDLDSVRVSPSGVVQLVVPIAGAVGVLLTTRRP